MSQLKFQALEPVFCHYIPEQLEEGKLYISMEYGAALHVCPCGQCGLTVSTPFGHQNGWTLTNADGRVTLRPSVGNWQHPCKTHYWITDNRLVDAG